MATEDRVATTEVFRSMHAANEGELLVAGALVEKLDPGGLHVLVPCGHVHGRGEGRLVCAAQLALTGEPTATEVDVVVSVETFEQLPTTFDVLRTATLLVPSTVDAVDSELAELLAGMEDGS